MRGDDDASECRVRTLADEFAVRIDHHRRSIVGETVAVETCDVAVDRPTGFDRMKVQRSDACVHDERE
ncbi:MAG: hypothetical protein EBZ40_00105 [Gammaproteobacteria bacterium]|nr:hypothetical protein [Gammaproteobacteria bacterium]